MVPGSSHPGGPPELAEVALDNSIQSCWRCSLLTYTSHVDTAFRQPASAEPLDAVYLYEGVKGTHIQHARLPSFAPQRRLMAESTVRLHWCAC